MSEKIQLTDTPIDVITKLSQGNIGAISVCSEILSRNPDFGLFLLLDLDDMGMRGPSIWLGFKDYAGQDLDKFITAARNRDPEMIATVNRNGGYAVPHGASSQ